MSACGGAGGDTPSSAAASVQSSSTQSSSGRSSSSTATQSSSSSSAVSSVVNSSNSSQSSSQSSNQNSSQAASSTSSSTTTLAAQLAVKLGKPARLLVGLGGLGSTVSNINAQSLKPDIHDRYLTGVGTGAWPSYNSPSGDYVRIVANNADSLGAVPMFTLYQMASNGDGVLTGLSNSTFMTQYWAQVKLMYQKIAAFNKPVLVNLEPDFWGYVQLQTNSNPASQFAYVNSNSDCSTYANNAIGIAGCLVHMARVYAPNAYVGFPPSSWGAWQNISAVISFMNTLGAAQADFIVAQTSDRDGGCFEVSPQPSYCIRTGATWYWGSTEFANHFAEVSAWHAGIGGLPVIWWQTPLGVPSSNAGGSAKHYRDNRVEYFLTHPAELIAAGGVGVVFGEGETNQTDITTDGGQFQRLSTAYFQNPATL